MPCFGTTSRTKSNAQRLAEAYGVTFRQVDITAAVEQHFQDIGQDPQKLDVTYENCQARERTQVLMDLANQSGGLVIGTEICRNLPWAGPPITVTTCLCTGSTPRCPKR